MNKIFFLLVGFAINLIAMDPQPKNGPDAKQKGTIELIERNAQSSGSVAHSSSIAKATSTSTVASEGAKASDSSSTSSDMAQIDLDKDGHELTKAQKRRSIIRLKAPAHSQDEEIREQLARALAAYKANEDQKNKMAAEEEKKQKRKSIVLFAEPLVPALNLSDMEKGSPRLSDQELNDMIQFIKGATDCDLTKVAQRLKKSIKEKHELPPDSPLFNENAPIIDAINVVRKLTHQYKLGTSRVETLRNRPGTPDQLRPAKPIEIIEDAGFKELDLLYKMVMTEKDAKQQDTDVIKGRYKLSTVVSGAVNIIALCWTIYQQTRGNSSSTCAPTNTTMPI